MVYFYRCWVGRKVRGCTLSGKSAILSSPSPTNQIFLSGLQQKGPQLNTNRVLHDKETTNERAQS